MTRCGAGYLPDLTIRQAPAVIAGDGSCGIEGGTVSRIAWFLLGWPRR